MTVNSGGGKLVRARTLVCGIEIAQDNGNWLKACGTQRIQCLRLDPVTKKEVPVSADAWQVWDAKSKIWGPPHVYCPADPEPIDVLAAIREQALRLLPHVATGHAYSDGALVNAEEIFWVDTAPTRNLPAATLVGHRVDIAVSIAHVHWDFGDSTTDDPSDPGRRYDAVHDPCHVAQCPDYYGHTYRHRGTVTVTSTVSWHARYRIDGGAWTDLPDPPLTGPTYTEQLRVVEARAVLVPN